MTCVSLTSVWFQGEVVEAAGGRLYVWGRAVPSAESAAADASSMALRPLIVSSRSIVE